LAGRLLILIRRMGFTVRFPFVCRYFLLTQASPGAPQTKVFENAVAAPPATSEIRLLHGSKAILACSPSGQVSRTRGRPLRDEEDPTTSCGVMFTQTRVNFDAI
jgi:hypothetical protein